MGRPKILNPRNERIMCRMDKRLREQLEKYAKHKNKTLSTIAKNAIEKFINEEIIK